MDWNRKIPKLFRDSMLTDFNQTIQHKVDNYLKIGKGLLIFGDVGCGKTRLMYAIANKLIKDAEIKQNVQLPPFVVEDCKKFIFDLHYYYTGHGECSLTQLLDKYIWSSTQRYIMLDDLGHGDTTKDEFAMNTLSILIDGIYSRVGNLIVVSNHGLAELIDRLGHYNIDRIRELCGDNIIQMTGKSKRI